MKKFFILLMCSWALNYPLVHPELSTRVAQRGSPKQTITLYYAPYCPYSREVLAYLNTIQKQIPSKNVKQDPAAKEELKIKGGVLEVPCLIIGDQALYSSETIIEWLKENVEELDPL